VIQPNTDLTGTGSDCVGTVMLTVRFVVTKSVKGKHQSLMFLQQISVSVSIVNLYSAIACSISPEVTDTACWIAKTVWQWVAGRLHSTEKVRRPNVLRRYSAAQSCRLAERMLTSDDVGDRNATVDGLSTSVSLFAVAKHTCRLK